jgi:hypothetical protein
MGERGIYYNTIVHTVLFTAADVLVLLNTLYDRAFDIVCDPETRLTFHVITLMMALGGFGPGAMMGKGKLPFKHISVALMRHLEDPSRIVPVVTISVRRNKLKKTMSSRKDNM